MFKGLNLSENFVSAIENGIKTNRLPHALVIEGKSSGERLSVAKEIAKALICKSSASPCGICLSCQKAEKNIHPDIHLIEKDEKSAMIKVDTVRDIKEKALVFPNESEKSVFIIHEAQSMNPQAQNALLKILEEPGSHVAFILTCGSKSSLLETVISRATAYSIGEEKEKKEDEKAEKARGIAEELLSVFAEGNELSFIEKTAPLQKDRVVFSLVLQFMANAFRDAAVLSSGGNALISENQEAAKKLAGVLTLKKNMAVSDYLRELDDSVQKSANINLTLTRLSSGLYSIKAR